MGGEVGVRLAEASSTPGLVIVAECGACNVVPAPVESCHRHLRWRVQTTFGYLVGDFGVASRGEALAAAQVLGELAIDWSDARLAAGVDSDLDVAARLTLRKLGLSRAAA